MKQRNRSVDCLRLLAAFSVVCLHALSGRGVWAGEEIVALSRYAVPLFFLFSGYFAAHYSQKRLGLQILRLFLLNLIGNALYLWVSVSDPANSWKPLWYQLQELYTPLAWRNFLLFNESPVSAHLWFLSALLYVLILDLLLRWLPLKLKNPRPLRAALAAGLFFGGLALYCFSGPELPLCAYRNFLFLGIPFYSLGKLMRDSSLPQRVRQLPVWGELLVVPALMGGTLLEYRLLGVKEIYLSQALLAIVLSTLAFAHPGAGAGRLVRGIAWMGQHCALTVYIIHVVILGRVEGNYYQHHPWQYELGLFHLNPLIAFVLSLAVALVLSGLVWCCRKLFSRLKGKPGQE